MIALVALLAIAEAAKLTLFCLAEPAPRVMDAEGYWELGTQVSQGDWWMCRNPIAFRTPGYPWYLGTFQLCFGEQAWFAAVAGQFVAVGITTALIVVWTWRATSHPPLCATALALCMVSAARASHASVLLTETWFTLGVTGTLLTLADRQATAKFKWGMLVGGWWGVTWLVRPVAIVLAPAWLLAQSVNPVPNGASAHRRWPVGALTLVILAAIIGPWVVRNQMLFQRASMTVFLGRNLWLVAFGDGRPAAHPLPETTQFQQLRTAMATNLSTEEWNDPWAVSRSLTQAGLSDADADERMGQVARQAIASDPRRAALRGSLRLINFWRTTFSRAETYYEHVPRVSTPRRETVATWNWPWCQRVRDRWLEITWETSLALTEIAVGLAFVGLAALWFCRDTRRLAAINTVALVSTAVLTSAVENPTYRYRMVIEPVLIVSAVVGWAGLVNGCRGERTNRSVVKAGREARP